MNAIEATIGTKIKSLCDFSGVPAGTVGCIDEDYGSGVMDLPTQPLPKGYREHDGSPAIRHGLLRDGFDKKTELKFLEVVT
jgi:hypothetical protein